MTRQKTQPRALWKPTSKGNRETIHSEDFRYKTMRFLGGEWKENERISKVGGKMKISFL